jgi:hypothetical protein
MPSVVIFPAEDLIAFFLRLKTGSGLYKIPGMHIHIWAFADILMEIKHCGAVRDIRV